jgi:hypothetical protein
MTTKQKGFREGRNWYLVCKPLDDDLIEKEFDTFDNPILWSAFRNGFIDGYNEEKLSDITIRNCY